MLMYVISGLLAVVAITLFVLLARRAMSWGPTEHSRSEGYTRQGPYPPSGGGGGAG